MAKPKLTPSARRSLLAQMSGTKRKKNPAAVPAIPGSKGGLTGSPLPSPRMGNKGRKKNPDIGDTKIAGTSLSTLAVEAFALLGGLLVGGLATSLVGNQLVGRVPPRFQAGGWLLGGLAAIIAGHVAERHFKLPFPLAVSGYAVASPMLLTAARQANIPGFGVAPVAVAPVTTEVATTAGTLAGGRAPGMSMAGTLASGNSPGTAAATFKGGGIASWMGRSIVNRLR